MEIIANDRKALDGFELDIFLPQIKLGIEWNGIVHFKPIFGEAKLNKIQTRDEQKQQIAIKNGINLIVVPDLVSKEKYVKEAFQQIAKVVKNLVGVDRLRDDQLSVP